MNQIKLVFNMTWFFADFKDLARSTASDKILHDRAFDIGKNLKHDGHQRGFALMKMKIFKTKSWLKKYTNQLLKNLRKKVRLSFIDNIWGVDLSDMHLMSKFI